MRRIWYIDYVVMVEISGIVFFIGVGDFEIKYKIGKVGRIFV